MRDVWGSYAAPDDYEAAAERGICKSTLNSRLARGWTVASAITVPVRKPSSGEYKHFKHLAMQNGIKYNTFKRRVLLGWSLPDAAAKPLVSCKDSTDRARQIKRRVIPKQIVIQAAQNGICYHTLYSRIQCGVSMSQAATMPIITSQQHPWRRDETDRINLIKRR
nr:MAG TPA: PVL ORF-50-like family [Caudoviricetes sp.]